MNEFWTGFVAGAIACFGILYFVRNINRRHCDE